MSNLSNDETENKAESKMIDLGAGDGNVTFSDKLPPTLLNHAKMMAIESIPLKNVLL